MYCLLMTQTSYPWKYFPMNRYSFDKSRIFARMNKNDSTVILKLPFNRGRVRVGLRQQEYVLWFCARLWSCWTQCCTHLLNNRKFWGHSFCWILPSTSMWQKLKPITSCFLKFIFSHVLNCSATYSLINSNYIVIIYFFIYNRVSMMWINTRYYMYKNYIAQGNCTLPTIL